MKLRIAESNGRIPNIVYHGGPVKINPGDFMTNVQPCFFTPYKDYADDYSYKGSSRKGFIGAYHLDIKNPFTLDDKECLRIYTEEFIPWAIEKGYADEWKNNSKFTNPKLGSKIHFVVADYLYVFLRKMKRKGIYNYDGMIVYEDNTIYPDSYVPLDKSQISYADE